MTHQQTIRISPLFPWMSRRQSRTLCGSMVIEFQFSGQSIGGNHPCFIIAEACDNHLGDMNAAREMARRAKAAGACAVKYQHHLPDEEMLPDLPMSDNFAAEEPLYTFLKKYALTLDQHTELKKFCEEEVGITYLCTPFSYQAAAELNSLGVGGFKIGSGEMTDLHSLLRIADFGKPMLVSTGMCEWEEIDRTYHALRGKNTPLALLSCVSEYPPVYEDINLDVITKMQARYPEAVIGHSDHTPDLFTCYAAVTLGAKIIEKHVILDKTQPGPDREVSIDFEELTELVDGIRKIEAARGSERKVHVKEAAVRTWAFRYAVPRIALAKGTTLTSEMIDTDQLTTKRTGQPRGVRSHQLPEVVGRTLNRELAANEPLLWADLDEA